MKPNPFRSKLDENRICIVFLIHVTRYIRTNCKGKKILSPRLQKDAKNNTSTGTMKLNSTVVLTSILLSSMFVIGIISAGWGFSFGTKALKGITQPAISPVLGGAARDNKSPRQRSAFLKEKDILKKLEKEDSHK